MKKNIKVLRSTAVFIISFMLMFLCCQSNMRANSMAMNDSISHTTDGGQVSTATFHNYISPKFEIVDRTKQTYSYQEMVEDLQLMQDVWSQCIRCEMRSRTYQGRDIPVVYLGNPEAKYHVMVQAAMHAREYMASLLVMTMIEHYARNYETGFFQGKKLKWLLEKVCFVIMPMVNPDGVEIAQRGDDGAVTADVKEWVQANTQAGIQYDQIKSNARGVDINHNFRNGFGLDKKLKKSKNYLNYPGENPLSEVESRLMLDVAQEYDFACFLNYHTSGNLIFYGCKNAPEQVNEQALKIADIVKRHTSYPLCGPEEIPECGTWADEVEVCFLRPSTTIELGTQNPVPISEFYGLYDKNLWVWADLAYAIISGQLTE